jgi:hypothetical protein
MMPRLENLFGVKNWSFLRNSYYYFFLTITTTTTTAATATVIVVFFLQMYIISGAVLCLSIASYMW